VTGTDERGVRKRERKRAKEGSRRGDSTVRGANGEIFGSPETRWWGRSISIALSFSSAAF